MTHAQTFTALTLDELRDRLADPKSADHVRALRAEIGRREDAISAELRVELEALIAETVAGTPMAPQQVQQQQARARGIPDFSQPVSVRVVTNTARRQLPVDRRYRNLPDETQPGTIEAWEAVAPIRPDTAHSRSLRFLDTASELLAAAFIIGGGMVLTGLATLL